MALAQQVEALDSEAIERLLGVIRELVVELHADRASRLRVRLDSDFDGELGFDSLARVELLERIRRQFDVELPDDLVGRFETPLDLLSALVCAEHPGKAELVAELELALGPSTRSGQVWPERARTLIEALDWHVREHPSRTCAVLVDGHGERGRLSFAELDRRARELGAGLRARQRIAGERVAVAIGDPLRLLVALWGVLYAGCVAVVCEPPRTGAEREDSVAGLAGILSHAGARVLIGEGPLDARLAALLCGRVASLEHTVGDTQLAVAGARTPPVRREPWELALISYTAGTEGRPKGVMLTHANVLSSVRATIEALAIDDRDRVLSWLPPSHAVGLIGALLASLYAAATAILGPRELLASDPSRWLWTVAEQRVTVGLAPNFVYARCSTDARSWEGLELDALRVAAIAGEPIAATTVREFGSKFSAFGLREAALTPVYGLSEAAGVLACASVDRRARIDRIDRRALERLGTASPVEGEASGPTIELVSCGRPVPGHELRVINPDGHESAARQQGRVQFRGPAATPGYFDDPAATAELSVEIEWRETGDLGYVADGELFVTGRSKALILRAGHGIHPQALEQRVAEIDGVVAGDVAAFGVYEPRLGTERVVIVAHTRLREPALRAALRERILASSAALLDAPADEVVLVGAGVLARTHSGERRRARCRELYRSGALERPPARAWLGRARFAVLGELARLRGAARTFAHLGYALWWWTASFCITLGLWPVVLLLRRADARWAALRRACRLIFRVTGIGVEVRGELPGEQAIIVANHQSYLDSLLLAAVVPGRASILAKRELAGNFASRSLLGRAGVVFVERYEPRRALEATAAAIEVARAGTTLVIFPEGATTRRPGLAGFRLGAFVVASQTGLPIVPAAIRGSRNVLRGQLMFPRRGRICVEFGPPMRATGQGWEATVALRDRARAWILARCGEPDLDREEHPLVTRLRRKLSGRPPA